MATIKARYLGGLRVECEHLQSGVRIMTDAPVDNHGKGEAFSPTDLCATALGTCILTIMGVYAEQHGIDLGGTEMEITKTMRQEPRKIGKIAILLHMPEREFSEKDKKVLERVAHTCPVYLSLNEDVEKELIFNWRK